MIRVKQPRVSVIKDNLTVGQSVPTFDSDSGLGMWIDQQYANKGHKVDIRGNRPDLPEYGIDNKSRKKGTKAAHTVGSMTVKNILVNPSVFETPFWTKLANQNHIEIDTDFNEISSVQLMDFDLKEIREGVQAAYASCREQLAKAVKSGGELPKNITSSNGWAVLDGYGKNNANSYRLRITSSRMKKMKALSGSRDTYNKLFSEE
jgi:hypothetical protein